MCKDTTREPTDHPTPNPAGSGEEAAEKQSREDARFHPGKHHDHMTIQAPETGITHVDPGAVVFR